MPGQVLVLVLLSVTISGFAQIFLKYGMSSPRVQEAMSSFGIHALYVVLTTPSVVSGLAMYVLGALMWLYILSRVNVSLAYPFVGLSFIITAFFAVLVLGERFSFSMLAGTLLIVVGVTFLARA